MHAVESELLDITKYKVRKRYADRQEYLRAILMAVANLEDTAYDKLSDPAADWAEEATNLYNQSKKNDLPDFDEVEASSADDDEADEAQYSDDLDQLGDEDREPDAEEPLQAPEADNEAVLEADDSGGDDDEPPPVAQDNQIKTWPPTKKRKSKVSKHKGKEFPDVKRHADFDHTDRLGDAQLDKWGCIVGSKNHDALELFAVGATTAEVKERIGGTYYNLLKKVIQRGHRVEKEGAMIKIIHKDDIGTIKTTKQKEKG